MFLSINMCGHLYDIAVKYLLVPRLLCPKEEITVVNKIVWSLMLNYCVGNKKGYDQRKGDQKDKGKGRDDDVDGLE